MCQPLTLEKTKQKSVINTDLRHSKYQHIALFFEEVYNTRYLSEQVENKSSQNLNTDMSGKYAHSTDSNFLAHK